MSRAICTYTGLKFDPLKPHFEAIRIEDIATALARMPRFAGHTLQRYSVAEHSVWVSRVCEPQDAAYGLLHDAAEAYLMDLPSPIKSRMPKYAHAEEALQRMIYRRFGLNPDYIKPPSVELADELAVRVERRDLMRPTDWWPALDESRAAFKRLRPAWTIGGAKRAFMRRYYELCAADQLPYPESDLLGDRSV